MDDDARCFPSNDNRVYRSKPSKQIFYIWEENAQRSPHCRQWIATAIFGCIVVFCAAKLITYGIDYLRMQSTSATLRAMYYEQDPQDAVATEYAVLPTAAPTVLPTAFPSDLPTAAYITAEPAQTTAAFLSPIQYPNNPYATVSSRFQKIQRQNRDIVGWLTIEDVIDEAVVQRDNDYYLDRDYRGYHNVNGAIFMEQTCDLSTRPYTIMLYGHNMKTGAMFGCLRNYENLHYYHNNAFVTFDTAYEDGRYVIFAVGTVNTNYFDRNYVDFTRLSSQWIEHRQQALNQLMQCSIYHTQINVTPEDQLLLLITCTADDEDRRIVAARRLRTDESEASVQQLVEATFPK